MAKKENIESDNKRQPLQESRSEHLFVRLYKGQIVPYHFFKRHWMLVVVVISMILMSIANNYDCQSKITEIKHLEKDLLVEQANRVDASARYNSLIRESSMKRLVDTMRIDLISPESPSFNLK